MIIVIIIGAITEIASMLSGKGRTSQASMWLVSKLKRKE